MYTRLLGGTAALALAVCAHGALAQDTGTAPADGSMAAPAATDPTMTTAPADSTMTPAPMDATSAATPSDVPPPPAPMDTAMTPPPPSSSGSMGMSSSNPTSFRGFRLEAQAGGGRFQSQGNHDDKFSYGGVAGFDGQIGDSIVIGPEVSYTRDKGENCQTGPVGFDFCDKHRYQIGAAIRAGFLVTPQVLVYGKAGYANDKQTRYLFGPTGSTRDRVSTDGYQVGGGVEFSLTDMFYVNGEYKYSNFADHTARQAVLGGVGIRFK